MKVLKNHNGGAKLFVTLFSILVLVVAGSVIFVKFYSYIFSKDISGEVMKVERVMQPGLIATGKSTNDKNMFSFAVAIKDRKTREIYTASTEDRKWAVVSEGLCVTAKFYPYPPWNLDKSGTYHNARLLRMRECDQSKKKKTNEAIEKAEPPKEVEAPVEGAPIEGVPVKEEPQEKKEATDS